MSKACKHAIGWQTKSCYGSENGCNTPADDQNKLSWLPGEATKTAGLDHSLVPRTDQLHSYPRPNLAKSDPIPLPLRLHLRFWTHTIQKTSTTTYLMTTPQRSRSPTAPILSCTTCQPTRRCHEWPWRDAVDHDGGAQDNETHPRINLKPQSSEDCGFGTRQASHLWRLQASTPTSAPLTGADRVEMGTGAMFGA